MLRFAAIVGFFLFPLLASGQKYLQSVMIGSAQDAYCSILKIDAQGNAYGVITSRYDITVEGKVYRGTSDFHSVIIKMDATGKHLWAKAFQGKWENDFIYQLEVDKSGNVYVSGSGSYIVLDDGKELVSGTFLIKLNAQGNTQWGIVSENTAVMSSQTGGPIAITDDAVFWSSTFADYLHLQGYNIATNNPYAQSPDAFIAKVSPEGKVLHIYHDPAKSSIPDILVPGGNGTVAAIINRGGKNKARVVLAPSGEMITDEAFPFYGDSRPVAYAAPDGYRMIFEIFKDMPNGRESQGVFMFTADQQLKITSQKPLFSSPAVARLGFNFIPYLDKGAFELSYTNIAFSYHIEWLYINENGEPISLPTEDVVNTYQDVFQRTMTQVTGETLNLLVRHLNYYSLTYTYNGTTYTNPTNLEQGFFWNKYVPEDPNACKRITVSVTNNGIENNVNAVLTANLPEGCPAEEDITIRLSEENPALNQNDFILPEKMLIKKGATAATAIISVLNDQVIEPTENFPLVISADATAAEYLLSSGSKKLTFLITDDDNTEANRRFNITYTPEIREGNTGRLTAALPGRLVLSAPLTLTFDLGSISRSATPTADYTPFTVTIPAGAGKGDCTIGAVTDLLLEGDEFIAGNIRANASDLGNFTSTDPSVNIKIVDADNTEANRIIEITPETSTINEGTSLTYKFRLAAPLSLQYPVAIHTSQTMWAPYIQQPVAEFNIGGTAQEASNTLTYPEDQVISPDRDLELGLSASDTYTGAYQFFWKGTVTDRLPVKVIDNDKAYLRLELSPAAITLHEGASGNVQLNIAGGRTLEEDLPVSFRWLGTNISADDRIMLKQGRLILPKGQTQLNLPFSTVNNQFVDINNERRISFEAAPLTLGMLNINPQAYSEVTLIDDDMTNLIIPNAFSPNGDGINDTWNIANLNLNTQCTVNIYNRLGQLLYSSIGYTTPWDGTFNHSRLPAGTYYYIIKSYGKTFSGSLALL